ncbi:MAG: hypothetical protein L0K67_10195 [Brevibacterium sp.]|nr:hypothetical protein [Brevibacterium sp.]
MIIRIMGEGQYDIAVVGHGKPVSDDFLGTSEAVVPFVDATLEEITELLTGEGFIPDPA